MIFCSTKTSPTEIQEFVTEDNKYCKAQYGDKRIIIWPNGDTMLRIWSDKDFKIHINTFVFKSENNELKLFEGVFHYMDNLKVIFIFIHLVLKKYMLSLKIIQMNIVKLSRE